MPHTVHPRSSGFAANMGVISSLCADGDVDIFSDELNHASIVDGARLAVRTGNGTTRLHVYRHNDLAHLEELLLHSQGVGIAMDKGVLEDGGRVKRGSSSLASTSGCIHGGRVSKRRLVVTDSLFSMDGDFADLRVRFQITDLDSKWYPWRALMQEAL